MTRTKLLALAALLGAAAPAAAQVQLNGAGATFPNIIYQDWILRHNQSHPNVKLNYQSIGSGGGIRQFSDGTVDFGGSDAPMSDSAIAAIQGNVLHIPTVMGAIVVTYTYDADDRLTAVSDNVSGAIITFAYDAASRVTGMTRSNGVNATITTERKKGKDVVVKVEQKGGKGKGKTDETDK